MLTIHPPRQPASVARTANDTSRLEQLIGMSATLAWCLELSPAAAPSTTGTGVTTNEGLPRPLRVQGAKIVGSGGGRFRSRRKGRAGADPFVSDRHVVGPPRGGRRMQPAQPG